eukprot:2355341-Prymnesium_polylepis.1
MRAAGRATRWCGCAAVRMAAGEGGQGRRERGRANRDHARVARMSRAGGLRCLMVSLCQLTVVESGGVRIDAAVRAGGRWTGGGERVARGRLRCLGLWTLSARPVPLCALRHAGPPARSLALHPGNTVMN